MEGLQRRELFLNGGVSTQTAGRLIVSGIRGWILRQYGNGGRVEKGCDNPFLCK